MPWPAREPLCSRKTWAGKNRTCIATNVWGNFGDIIFNLPPYRVPATFLRFRFGRPEATLRRGLQLRQQTRVAQWTAGALVSAQAVGLVLPQAGGQERPPVTDRSRERHRRGHSRGTKGVWTQYGIRKPLTLASPP